MLPARLLPARLLPARLLPARLLATRLLAAGLLPARLLATRLLATRLLAAGLLAGGLVHSRSQSGKFGCLLTETLFGLIQGRQGGLCIRSPLRLRSPVLPCFLNLIAQLLLGFASGSVDLLGRSLNIRLDLLANLIGLLFQSLFALLIVQPFLVPSAPR